MERRVKSNGIAQARGVSRRAARNGLGKGFVAGCAGMSRAFGQATGAVPFTEIRRAAPSGAWATGGTAAMRAAATYPDPFQRIDAVCSLTCQQILGPCWAPKAAVRQDISEIEAISFAVGPWPTPRAS
jgi:hypothetical protein